MISIGNMRVKPGQKKWGTLHVREKGKTAVIPLVIINGKKPGKRMVLIGGQHADEIGGIEGIRRFCTEVDPQKLSGCIMAIPSANPKASMLGACCWAEDRAGKKSDGYNSRYNMYYLWPGKTGGTLVEHVVSKIWNEIIHYQGQKPDLLVDVHRAGMDQYACIMMEQEQELELALASGVKRIANCRREEGFRLGRDYTGGRPIINMLQGLFYVAPRAGILHLLVELPGRNLIYDKVAEEYRSILWNLAVKLGMAKHKIHLPDEVVISDPWRTAHHPAKPPSYVRHTAQHSGLVVRRAEMLETVKKNQIIAEVLDPFSAKIIETGRAAIDGMVLNMTYKGVCHKGECLFTVCEAWKMNPKVLHKGKGTKLKTIVDSLFSKNAGKEYKTQKPR